MKKSVLQEKILEVLEKNRANPPTLSAISEVLGFRRSRVKKLGRVLQKMVESGLVTRVGTGRYVFGPSGDLVTGTLDVLRSGAGIVRDDRRNLVVRIAAGDLATALPGDRVTVRIATPGAAADEAQRNRITGKVIRILERRHHDIVGTLRSVGGRYYVVPLDPAYRHRFRVRDPGGANLDDRVVVRFVDWPRRDASPEGEIVDRIGPSSNPSLDTVSVIRQFGLRTSFPSEVVREAETVSELVNRAGDRLDLRGLFVLTIDPARARDFDDALSLEKGRDSTRILGVHIADVSHFVRPGSALDEEARRRGTSVYFPDGVLPMLPEQLSNGVCSLKPGEDRLAFSVLLTVDTDGNILKSEFARTIIRSRLRLTYEQVLPILDPGAAGEPFPESDEKTRRQAVRTLRAIHRIAQQWRAQRFARFALDLDVPECEMETDRNGVPTSIKLTSNDVSHQLIEECMVAANEAVARALTSAGVPMLYRIHEKPHADKIEELTAQLHLLGIEPGDLRNRRNLAALLASVAGTPLVYHVRTAVLRSMNRAVYSARPDEHFGLAKRLYTHFTSPIRRYPDLVVHRQLAAWLESPHGVRHLPHGREELHALAESCSRAEQAADEAERAVDEIKKYRYLERLVAEGARKTFPAVVVAVTKFGLFAELVDLQLQGLIHVSTLSKRFVRFNRRDGSLQDGSKVYRLGQQVTVRVINVDFDQRRIDFQPA